MLVKPSLDQLLPMTANRYTLAILVAKRARQLIDGGLPMVDSETPNMVTLSSEEVAAGTVLSVPGIQSPEVPLRPEIIEARLAAAAAKEESARLEIIHEGNVISIDAEEVAREKTLDIEAFKAGFEEISASYDLEKEEMDDEEADASDLMEEGDEDPMDASFADESEAESESVGKESLADDAEDE